MSRVGHIFQDKGRHQNSCVESENINCVNALVNRY